MKCIKTGCDVFLSEYGSFAHGDAFESDDGSLVIRVSSVENEPIGSRRHFTVDKIEHFFDQNRIGVVPGVYGTLFARIGDYANHGYQGIVEPAMAD